MYTKHFGFREKPFELSPDPRFLYLSEEHKEAFAHLKYAVMEWMGFIVITGDVGTGKTTLLNTLLEGLDSGSKKVHLTDPGSTVEDLFYLIKRALDLPIEDISKGKILPALNDFMRNRLSQNERVLLVIDEAQRFSPAILEEIWLLSNIETPGKRLFQIFLVGQQELNNKLKAPELKRLCQRIGVKYHLKPFNLRDTQAYIMHRLHVAGFRAASRKDSLFTLGAIKNIYKFSQGYPRLINLICERALITAHAKGLKEIGRNVIDEVATAMKASNEIPKKRTNLMFAWSTVLIVLLAVLTYGIYKNRGIFKMLSHQVEDSARSIKTAMKDKLKAPQPSGVVEQEPSQASEKPAGTLPQPSKQETRAPAFSETAPIRNRILIQRSAIALAVRDREPKGVSQRISVRQKRVYCWVHVINSKGRRITLRWIRKGHKITDIHLPVGSNSWRTWSYTTLKPTMIGSAQVHILDENGKLLKTLSFEITE